MATPDDFKKKYTCNQAQIIADTGNTMQADIMETGEIFAERLFTMREDSRKSYWKLHVQIAKHGFDGTMDQTEAVAKLGQFAIAVEAISKAYSAVNTVRCFT